MATFAVSTQVGARYDELRVLVEGEVDLATAPILETELTKAIDAGPRTIVIDLAELAFLDSSGCHVLLKASRRADDERIPVELVRVPDRVRRVFELAGILEFLAIREESARLTPSRGTLA